MDWTPVIDALIKAVTGILIIVIGYVGSVGAAWVTKAFAKWKDNWYIDKAIEAVAVGIDFAAKTFVDALKDKGDFLEVNWPEAMQKCIEAAKAQMPNKVMEYVENSRGDLEAWIVTTAEAMLEGLKPKPEVQ